MNFDYQDKPEEVSSGISPFIEAPGYTLSYPDADSFTAVTSNEKKTPGIEFIMVENAITEGVDKNQYGGRRKSKQTIWISEKSWDSVTRPFISKLGDHYFGKETALKILKSCGEAYNQKQSLEDLRNRLINIFKQVFREKKPAFFLYEGQASYKAKDDNSGYWRSVYPGLNMMGTTVRPNTEQGKKEMQEYFDKNKDKLLKDTGEPASSGNRGGMKFDTDMGDVSGNTTSNVEKFEDDWDSF